MSGTENQPGFSIALVSSTPSSKIDKTPPFPDKNYFTTSEQLSYLLTSAE